MYKVDSDKNRNRTYHISGRINVALLSPGVRKKLLKLVQTSAQINNAALLDHNLQYWAVKVLH
jgi:hypothetical protein